MTRACVQAVRDATGDVFSEAEIDDLLNRFTEKARRAKKADPTADDRVAIRQAAQELTKEELKEAFIKKRLEVARKRSLEDRRPDIDGRTGDESQQLRSFLVGSEVQGWNNSRSVDAEGRALTMEYWGDFERDIRAMPGLIDRMGNFLGTRDRAFEERIATEVARYSGDARQQPTGDEAAEHVARAWVERLNQATDNMNAQGAWISKLPGYIARQSHDRLKISGGFWRELAEIGRRVRKQGIDGFDWASARQGAAARAFREWHDFIRPLLDDRTFEGLDEEDVSWRDVVKADTEEEAGDLARRAAIRNDRLAELAQLHAAGVVKDPKDLRELMLYRVWSDIVIGRHEQLTGANDEAEFRPPASKAASVSKARVLHFQGPKEWMDYADRYSRGSLFQTMMLQLERSARNATLMKYWGPNPDLAYQAEVERLAQKARARGDVPVANKLYSSRQAADFDALNGRLNTPENLRLAVVLRGMRSWEAITKLGGIVLSKATDLPMTGHAFVRAGSTFLAGYEGAFRGILHLQSDEAQHAAELLHVGARSFAGHLGGKFSLNDGSLGWSSWATRLMYKLNAFEFINEGVRKGAAEMLSRHLGEEATKGWGDIHPGTRETLERFGINPHGWDLLRRGTDMLDDGKRYFTLDHLDDRISDREIHQWAGTKEKAQTPDAADRARSDLELRARTMIHNILDDTTSEARMREQAAMSAGLRSGTPLGEAVRAFMQFKGFTTTILGRHLAPALNGYAGRGPVALMAHFLAASTLAGFIGMNAKMIAGGQMPRPIWGQSPAETAKIWLAALAQGGGLGIYGDFLFGEQNRNGLQFTLSSLGGPAIGDAESLLQVLRQALYPDAVAKSTGQSQIAPELARLAKSNIPLINVFYTRLALDYLFLWRLQEHASPGYLQRYQQRIEQEEGRHFIVPPTAAAQW